MKRKGKKKKGKKKTLASYSDNLKQLVQISKMCSSLLNRDDLKSGQAVHIGWWLTLLQLTQRKMDQAEFNLSPVSSLP